MLLVHHIGGIMMNVSASVEPPTGGEVGDARRDCTALLVMVLKLASSGILLF